MEVGGKSICFLDLKISIANDELETTTVYSKATDSYLYLQAYSCHKLWPVTDIKKGVALCLRCICSTGKEYKSQAGKYLQLWTHNMKVVNNFFTKVAKKK